MTVLGNCWVCGKKIIDPYQKKVAWRKYRTCSVKCHNKFAFECLPLNEIEKRSQIKCQVCGKPASFRRGYQYYCSEECRRIAFASIKAWNDKFDAWLEEEFRKEEAKESKKQQVQQLSLF